MKYMLIIAGKEGGMEDVSPEEMKAVMDRWSAYGQELVDAGAFIVGEALQNATQPRSGSATRTSEWSPTARSPRRKSRSAASI